MVGKENTKFSLIGILLGYNQPFFDDCGPYRRLIKRVWNFKDDVELDSLSLALMAQHCLPSDLAYVIFTSGTTVCEFLIR